MSIRPRIYHGERNEDAKKDNLPPGDPTFFTEICKFPNVAAYREALEEVISDEQSTFNTYTRQVFHLAQINAVKYRHLRRGTFLTIATVAIEALTAASAHEVDGQQRAECAASKGSEVVHGRGLLTHGGASHVPAADGKKPNDYRAK